MLLTGEIASWGGAGGQLSVASRSIASGACDLSHCGMDSLFLRFLNSSITSNAKSLTLGSNSGSSMRIWSISLCNCARVFEFVSMPKVFEIETRFSFRLIGCVFRRDRIDGAIAFA